MKKSVYSVVLADNVIEKIDRLAYMQSTNRSNMINQILAEYVSLVTPEKRISNIFDELARHLYSGDVFSELSPPTSSVMNVRTALSYKYNPTVRYSIELFREPGGEQGVIRVSTRTSNSVLLEKLLHFFGLWTQIESEYGFEGESCFENGVFRRPIIHRRNPHAVLKSKNGASAAELLAEYISLFDSSMKTYFANTSGAVRQIEAAYADYIRNNREII